MLQPLVSPVSSSSMLLGMDPSQSYSNALCPGHSEIHCQTSWLEGNSSLFPGFLWGESALGAAGMMNSGAGQGQSSMRQPQYSPSDTAVTVGKKAFSSLGSLGTAAEEAVQLTKAA